MKVEPHRAFYDVARGDIDGHIWRQSRLVLGREAWLGEQAGHFKFARDKPLDDLFSLGDKQARLPSEISLAQLAIGRQSRILDGFDRNEHGKTARARQAAARGYTATGAEICGCG